MSARVHPRGECPCLRTECRNARRAENVRAVLLSAIAVFIIFASLWAVELLGATP